MRESCVNCCRKHIGNAIVLSHEVMLGYPEFAWLVVGHLSQAEEEISRDNIALAATIRQYRLQYMDCIESDFSDIGGVPNFMLLIEMVTAFHKATTEAENLGDDRAGLFDIPKE